MKISPIVLALVPVNSEKLGPADSVQKLENERRRHPQNKLHQLNKLLNRYTIMLKGFPASNDGMNAIINSDQGKDRNLGDALTRNNQWCNRMLNTFYRTTATGDNVACSKYFHQDDDSRKRRSADWDLELDGDSFAYQCEMIQNDFDAGVEVGEESGECEDCCDQDEDGNYIQDATLFRNGKLQDAPENMAKAMRRVMGAAKKWGQRWIKECGGQQAILSGQRTPHYTILRRLLKNGMRHDDTLEAKILELKWKRVFPVSTINAETGKKDHHKHADFFSWLGIEA